MAIFAEVEECGAKQRIGLEFFLINPQAFAFGIDAGFGLQRQDMAGGMAKGNRPRPCPARGEEKDGSALEFAQALDGWVLDEENRAGVVEKLQVAVRGEA